MTSPATTQTVPEQIFVTGASRSGTTMLSRMLGNHSKIAFLRELHYFGGMVDPGDGHRQLDADQARRAAEFLSVRLRADAWNATITNADTESATRICENLTEAERTGFGLFAHATQQHAQAIGKVIPCEQTPRNIFYASDLLSAYPDARIVHVVRDPRAVLASQKNRWHLRRLGSGKVPVREMLRVWVNYHPITMSHLWNRATAVALALADHPRFHIVRFEDAVAGTRCEIIRICRFLGIEFEEEMVNVPQWGSSNVDHKQQKSGIAEVVVDQWRHQLNRSEIEIVERASGQLMSQCGYQPSREMRSLWPMLYANLTYPLHLAGVVVINPKRALTLLTGMWRAR